MMNIIKTLIQGENDEHYRSNLKGIEQNFEEFLGDIYRCCFSGSSDQPNLRQSYGNYSIEFSPSSLNSLRVRDETFSFDILAPNMQNVTYGEKEANAILRDFFHFSRNFAMQQSNISIDDIVRIIAHRAIQLLATLKPKEAEEEEETRIIWERSKYQTDSAVSYREENVVPIPYVRLVAQSGRLDVKKIRIGPAANKEQLEQVKTELLLF